MDALASFGIPALGIPGAFGWRGTNEVGAVTALPDWEEVAIKGKPIHRCLRWRCTHQPRCSGSGAAAVRIYTRQGSGQGSDIGVARQPGT